MPPKLSVATRVTVPEAAAYAAPWASSASVSQDQPTAGEHRVGDHVELDLGAGVGHAAEGAVPRVVAGGVVEQDDPAGADVGAVDGDVGAAARRRAGAIRCGAGISSQKISGRSRAARMLSTAARNSGGGRARTRPRVRLLPDDHVLTVGPAPAAPMCEHAGRPARLPAMTGTLDALPRRACSCGRPAASPCRTPRSGSCARRAARCRSTSRSARASGCSSPAWTPTWSPRSRSSRCAGTASTRRSSSPTSCCRSRRSASTSTSCPASARSSPSPVRTLADVEAIPDLEPGHVAFITEAVRALVGELGGTPADRLRRRAVHGGVVPRRGRSVEGPRADQGDDVRRARRLGRADAQDRRHLRGLPRGPGRGGRLGRAAVRLVGGRADAGRLRRARDAALGRRARARRRARRARASTSASAPPTCWR